jgi:transposase-like protein
MKADEREIRRKRRILDHALESGNIAKTCRYFGIPRSLFYVWRNAYQKHGEEGLWRKKPIEKGRVIELKRVGGLHHLYARMAA